MVRHLSNEKERNVKLFSLQLHAVFPSENTIVALLLGLKSLAVAWIIREFKAWFPYRCICRVCRTKKIHRTDTSLWKPPVQMLNAKETTDTTLLYEIE